MACGECDVRICDPNMDEGFLVEGWRSVDSSVTPADFFRFQDAVNLWIERPNVVNRRLMGALIVKKMFGKRLTGSDLLSIIDAESKCLFQDTDLDHKTWQCEGGDYRFGPEDKEASGSFETQCFSKDSAERQDGEESVSCIVRKLIPRQAHGESTGAMLELVILERNKSRVCFCPLSPMAMEKGLKSYEDLLDISKSYSFVYHQPSCKGKPARVSLLVMDSATLSENGRDGISCPTIHWLKDILLPKLCKWAGEVHDSQVSRGSLRLVPLDQYTKIYQRLKQDYGDKFVKMWPERTDPQKFVYEDIAIASYLLLLWKKERHEKNLKQKQSFVDLGCGNGFLVHILSKEGHPGSGIDLRRRKIWDLYGEDTSLQEKAVNPTLPSLFPDVDWLIGNHSDELTPWIPVMAARSSTMAQYFVLPCCLFDFNCKFNRKNSKVTQYRGYLDFVYDVGEKCGFHVEEDSLRIPSTKRICHIGRPRTFTENNDDLRIISIKDMIQERGCNLDDEKPPETLRNITSQKFMKDSVLFQSCATNHVAPHEQSTGAVDIQRQDLQPHATEGLLYGGNASIQTTATKSYSTISKQSPSSFQPRAPMESVRNCTTLERSLKENIVSVVARYLLGLPLSSDNFSSPLSSISKADKDGKRAGAFASKWRKGGTMQICEVAKLFDKDTLVQLKHECGGLQTLLRNHYHIFKVAGGLIEMKDWSQESLFPGAKKRDLGRKLQRSYALRKTSFCWFYLHHPDGCPVPAENCRYAHTTDDLRERPSAEVLNSL